MFGKDGFLRAMDASDGHLLRARETYFQNTIADIDMETGQAVFDEGQIAGIGATTMACPGLYGGRNWPGDAIDPTGGSTSWPTTTPAWTTGSSRPRSSPGEYHDSADFPFRHVPSDAAEGEEMVGSVAAYEIATGREVWRHDRRAPWFGGLLSTAGGLVFGGGVDRTFRAFDADTGETLWSTRLTTSLQGYPVTYEAGGEQYLAVPAGYGLAFPELTPEIPQPDSGAALFVFELR